MPLVLASRRIYGLDVDVVLLDDVGGAYRGTLALLDAGHTRIGYLGNVSSAFTGTRRYEGYLRALEERGIQPDPDLVLREQQDAESSSDATRRLLDLDEPPTAIFSANNRNSIGALHEIGRRLRAGASPAEMPALVSFDDFELAELMPVPVTVVDHDPRQLGREAARLLLSRLGDRRGSRRSRRGSSRCPCASRRPLPRPDRMSETCDDSARRYGNVTNADPHHDDEEDRMRTVAIDLGGTAVKLGVFESGRLVADDEFAAVDGQIGLDEVADRVESLLAGERPAAIGIAVPGVVDPEGSSLLAAHGKYAELHDLDLSAWSQCPIRMPRRRRERRTRGAHRRDHRRQRARHRGMPCSSSSARDRRGRRHRRPASSAGATATARSSAATSPSTSTARGAPAATSAAPRRSRARGHLAADAAAGDLALGPQLAARLAGRGAIGIRDLVETRDEPESAAILDRYIRTWAAVIVTQCHAFDPEVVIVTGGVMRAADVILPALRERVHADLWSSSFRPAFVTPDDPSTSVLRGLAALADDLESKGRP